MFLLLKTTERDRIVGMKMRPILLVAAASLLAQDATIRVDVQQVLVPVVVTDQKGHHVSGLRAADFRISEDGVPQEIAAFSSDKAGSVDDLVALSQAAGKSGPRHTFVICIDTLHASPSNAARTRQALESLFETEKPAGAQYVLIGIGRQLQVLQPATANPLEILVKIRSAAWQNSMSGMDASALSVELRQIRNRLGEFCKRCACADRQGQGTCESEVDTLQQAVDGEAERWAAPLKALAEQLGSVVEELAKLPTGRTLILVSDGFNLDAKRDFYAAVSAYLPDRPQFKLADSDRGEAAFQEALKVAAARNVTIYTLDSRGAGAAPSQAGPVVDATASGANNRGIDMLGTNRPSPRSGRTAPLESTASPQASMQRLGPSVSMEQLARATGGMYFRDSGDLLKEFRTALADGREYYVLAYVPKNGAHDGKYRTISVETVGKKLNVRAKPGYWADGAAQ
jgi:VWFA-related protein